MASVTGSGFGTPPLASRLAFSLAFSDSPPTISITM